MKRLSRSSALIAAGLSILFAAPAAAEDTQNPNGEIVLRFDFSNGSAGWLPGLSDYSLSTSDLRFRAEIRQLPPEVDNTRRGYYLQSMNRSDDLFMFLKRELTQEDGLQPNTTYSVSIDVGYLSNAPSGAVGVGGAPGESVWLKAGITVDEPVTTLTGDYVHLNIDKGEQSQSGRDAGVVSDIANGLTSSPEDGSSPYVYLTRVYHHPTLVRTDHRGSLWTIIGTDSGFEGLTGIYYYSVIVTLRPIPVQE
jgi:hypothetical protein